MEFFDGLYPYEIVMLVLGVLLFLVLILAFVALLMRGKPYGRLLLFFPVSIVMIGFPSVKSFEISASVVKMERYVRGLEEDPTNRNLRKSLEQEVASVSDRPIVAPRASTTIARAQIALGNESAGVRRLAKVLQAAPQLPDALELKKRIELDRDLSALTSQVEQDPNNTAAKTELATTVREVTQLPIASPETMTKVALAQKALGDQAKARDTVDKALTIDPNLAPAIRLREQIRPTLAPAVPDNR